MVINRVAALVLPYSTRFFIDTSSISTAWTRLQPLVLLCWGDSGTRRHFFFADAVLIEGRTAADAELRQQVQVHISRLPVAFYDVNKTGSLVSRIMSDVEGVRTCWGQG